MTTAIFCAVLAGLSPAHANDDVAEGFDLFEEATRLMLKGLIEELGPAWDEMQGVLDNLSAYHAPEVLPNGDIIIRRKVPFEPENDAETEL